MTQEERKEKILGAVRDSCQSLLKENWAEITAAVHGNETGIWEMTRVFGETLAELIPFRYDPETFVPVLEGTVVTEEADDA